jgi:hypothetical protein
MAVTPFRPFGVDIALKTEGLSAMVENASRTVTA